MLKPIYDFDGYFISDDGNVYCNLGKGNRNRNNTTNLYVIKPRVTKTGYCRIYARQTSTGKRKDLYIHRLVANYFIPKTDICKNVVNHKNCIRSDNRAENLEWCTTKENVSYAMMLGNLQRDQKTGRFIKG